MLNSCPKSEDLPGLSVLILVRKTWRERGELRGEGVHERGAYRWSGERTLSKFRILDNRDQCDYAAAQESERDLVMVMIRLRFSLQFRNSDPTNAATRFRCSLAFRSSGIAIPGGS